MLRLCARACSTATSKPIKENCSSSNNKKGLVVNAGEEELRVGPSDDLAAAVAVPGTSEGDSSFESSAAVVVEVVAVDVTDVSEMMGKCSSTVSALVVVVLLAAMAAGEVFCKGCGVVSLSIGGV